MKIRLAPYLSPEITQYSELLNSFECNLSEYFNKITYGDGIVEIYIGVICISPKFEQFFKSRKPKYTFDNQIYEKEGMVYSMGRTLEYDVNLDFETVQHSTELEVEKILANEILKSLKVVDEMKSKIKDFDTAQFKSDLETYFKGKRLI